MGYMTAATTGVILNSGNTVFNEGSRDKDFRIETDDETHALFVDGGNNRVSIGDSVDTPTATLEITNHASSGATGVPVLKVNSNDVDKQAVHINAANTTAQVLNILANALTTGKVIDISATGLTTGNAINLVTSSVPGDGGVSTVNSFVMANTSVNTQTAKGLLFDFNKTGATASGKTATITGIHLDLDDFATNHGSGTVNMTGLDIDVTTANSQGTQSNTGLKVAVAGGDTNYAAIFSGGLVGIGVADPDTTLEVLSTTTQLKLSYDTNSFAALTVDASSNLTLATGESGVIIMSDAVQISGLTASEIVITDANKRLTSAAVATYPSLAELAYVKGVTSSIQSQISAITAGGSFSIHGQAAAAIASGDFLAFSDTSASNATKKESIDDVATLFAGAGMTATNAVLNVIGGDGIDASANDISVIAAQTTITSVINAGLVVGRDSHNIIDFSTDDTITFTAANVEQVKLIDNVWAPVADSDVDLGTNSLRWKDAYIDTITTTGTISGGSSITAAGVVSVSDGSAGAPSLTNTGDTNTGLFFSAADTLAFTAGGTAQFTMADGVIAPVTDTDVELGTSSLYFKKAYIDAIQTTGNVDIDGGLDVAGNVSLAGSSVVLSGILRPTPGSAGAPSISTAGDTNTGLFFSAADTLAFTAGGTAQFTMADGVIAPVTDSDVELGTSSLFFKKAYIDAIRTTGRIGVGIDATVALHVSGQAIIEDNPTTSDGTDQYLTVKSNADSARIVVSADTDVKVPAIHLIDSEANSGNFSQQHSAYLMLDRGTNPLHGGQNDLIIANTYPDRDIYISTNTGSAGTEATLKMIVKHDGNVGIGVADPDTTLEVFKAGTQLKLSFDGTDNATFAVDTAGDLTITPSGNQVIVDGVVQTTGNIELGAATDTTLSRAAAGILAVEGVKVSMVGKQTMWIPAAAMYANTTAGCSALTQVELANGPELKVLDFAAAADDHAQFTISMPKSWNEGTVTFQPYWTVTGTNTGTVVWGMSAVACADNATQNVTFGSIAVTAAKAHSGTSNDINVSAESAALTIKNAAVDTLTYFQIFNDTSASGQTGVVRLTGIKLLYTTDAVNDA